MRGSVSSPALQLRRLRVWGLAVALITAAQIGGRPAAGDWLVLQDGTKVETDGGWEVKGSIIVFHGVNGSLLSLPAADVDLEASERATEEALAPPPPPPVEPKRQARIIITDADVGHIDPATLYKKDEPKDAAKDEAPNPLTAHSVERVRKGDGTEVVRGVLKNGGANAAGAISLRLVIAETSAGEHYEQQVPLTANTLLPGQEVPFEVSIDGLYYGEVEFRPQSVALKVGADDEKPADRETENPRLEH